MHLVALLEYTLLVLLVKRHPMKNVFVCFWSSLKGFPWSSEPPVLAVPSGYYQTVEGTLEGVIADAPRGQYGFGYDPIFFIPELGKTSAELTPEQKNRISHRGRAAQLAAALLKNWPGYL